MYLIYQWHPFGSNLSSFHPSFFSFIFSLFSFFSPSLLPSFSPSFLPSLPLSFSSISSKKHIYTNITNLDSVHSCFLPIIIVTACANGEKPALVTLQVFVYLISSLYITYFLFLLPTPPLQGCPPHLPRAPRPQAGLPSYKDTLPTSHWLNTHTKQALLKRTTSVHSQALTHSYVPTLTCVDIYLLPCLTSPGDFGHNCSDREEEE